MTIGGWFVIQNSLAYGWIFFRFITDKYQAYMEKNKIKIKSYNRGLNSRPFIFLIFINSCFLMSIDNTYFVDYNAIEPWLIDFLIRDWDEDKKKYWYPDWPLFGFYKIYNYYNYSQGDWGLPNDMKIHKFLIFLWWIWLAKEIYLNLYKQFKDFYY